MSNILGYREVALVLLMTVSLLAMLFDFLPVVLGSIASALIWNYFFIPPIFTFHISSTEDILLFLLYFLIALVNTVLTFKIRQSEKKARDKEEKEKTIKLYDTLLHSLSHELKTPISTILGSVDMLKDSEGRLSTMQALELLNQIEVASTRLNRQVENLLHMSRLESGMLKPRLDWFDVNEVVNSVIQKVKTDAKQIILFNQNDKTPFVKTDIAFLEQIIFNLLQNAVLYTPEDSLITITLTFDEHGFILYIEDDGNGFPEKEVAFIFDKFYRLPNSRSGGIGLGLSIVKGFTEALNGEIKLHNQKNGACFEIHIPTPLSYINQLKNE